MTRKSVLEAFPTDKALQENSDLMYSDHLPQHFQTNGLNLLSWNIYGFTLPCGLNYRDDEDLLPNDSSTAKYSRRLNRITESLAQMSNQYDLDIIALQAGPDVEDNESAAFQASIEVLGFTCVKTESQWLFYRTDRFSSATTSFIDFSLGRTLTLDLTNNRNNERLRINNVHFGRRNSITEEHEVAFEELHQAKNYDAVITLGDTGIHTHYATTNATRKLPRHHRKEEQVYDSTDFATVTTHDQGVKNLSGTAIDPATGESLGAVDISFANHVNPHTFETLGREIFLNNANFTLVGEDEKKLIQHFDLDNQRKLLKHLQELQNALTNPIKNELRKGVKNYSSKKIKAVIRAANQIAKHHRAMIRTITNPTISKAQKKKAIKACYKKSTSTPWTLKKFGKICLAVLAAAIGAVVGAVVAGLATGGPGAIPGAIAGGVKGAATILAPSAGGAATFGAVSRYTLFKKRGPTHKLIKEGTDLFFSSLAP